MAFLGLRESNALDLDIGILGQGLHGHAATGGLVDHPLGVLLVHRGEVTHVGEEDVDLDDLLDGRASGGEDGLQVLEAECCLLTDGALEHVARGIQVDLTRAVDGRRGLDGVGLYSEVRGYIQHYPVSDVIRTYGPAAAGYVSRELIFSHTQVVWNLRGAASLAKTCSAIVRLGVSAGRKMAALLDIWKREETLLDGDRMDRTGVNRRLSDMVIELGDRIFPRV